MHESKSQKILKRKHWIKTYEKRIEDYKAMYKGPLLESKLIALNHKIYLWKRAMAYLVSAREENATCKGAHKVNKEKNLLDFIAKAKLYFYIERGTLVGKGKTRKLSNIFACKYVLENDFCGVYAYERLGVTRSQLYYYRKLYNSTTHGSDYRFFKKAMN